MRILPGYLRTANSVFSSLPANEFNVVYSSLARVRLVLNQRLVEQGQPAEHAFFIEEGIASLVAQTGDGGPGIQVAMIGREGMVGAMSLLGESVPYGSVVVQVPGMALRISMAALQRSFDQCPVLRQRCLASIQALTRQVMSTAVSNASNTLAERCVRWLLMAHDRMGEDDLPVTHEALSTMLGVRRSGVTVATAALQEAGLIRTRRGRIRVLDRPGLEAVMNRRLESRRRTPPATLDGSGAAAGAAA